MADGNGIEMTSAVAVTALHETAVAASAAQAEALVKAQYAIAVARPRDLMDFRARLLEAAKRPKLAEIARYAKPVGGQTIEGRSIRAVEEALRHYRNTLCQTLAIYDDEEKRIVRVLVIDLETNSTHSTDVTVQKTVERSRVRDGQEVIGERVNTRGQKVFIVRATDDDLLNKQNALISKAIRNAGERILPGDVLEEMDEQVSATLKHRDAQDPQAAVKKLADAFHAIGVMPSDLRAYIGVELVSISPKQLQDLRAIYQGIRSGETTWAEVVAAKAEEVGKPAGGGAEGRKSATVDKKDLDRIEKAATKRATELGDSNLAALIIRDAAEGAKVKAVASLAKSDLPAFLTAISSWEPSEPGANG